MTPLKDVSPSVLAEQFTNSDVLLLALTRGVARWDTVSEHGGEVCLNGMRHFVRYSRYGLPIPSSALANLLLKAIIQTELQHAEVK